MKKVLLAFAAAVLGALVIKKRVDEVEAEKTAWAEATDDV